MSLHRLHKSVWCQKPAVFSAAEFVFDIASCSLGDCRWRQPTQEAAGTSEYATQFCVHANTPTRIPGSRQSKGFRQLANDAFALMKTQFGYFYADFTMSKKVQRRTQQTTLCSRSLLGRSIRVRLDGGIAILPNGAMEIVFERIPKGFKQNTSIKSFRQGI